MSKKHRIGCSHCDCGITEKKKKIDKNPQIIECYACGKSDRPLVSFGKNSLCQSCISLDNKDYESIDINIDDVTLLRVAKTAMEENVTMNAVISHVLLQYVRNPKLLKEFTKNSCNCSKNGCHKKSK